MKEENNCNEGLEELGDAIYIPILLKEGLVTEKEVLAYLRRWYNMEIEILLRMKTSCKVLDVSGIIDNYLKDKTTKWKNKYIDVKRVKNNNALMFLMM